MPSFNVKDYTIQLNGTFATNTNVHEQSIQLNIRGANGEGLHCAFFEGANGVIRDQGNNTFTAELPLDFYPVVREELRHADQLQGANVSMNVTGNVASFQVGFQPYD